MRLRPDGRPAPDRETALELITASGQPVELRDGDGTVIDAATMPTFTPEQLGWTWAELAAGTDRD